MKTTIRLCRSPSNNSNANFKLYKEIHSKDKERNIKSPYLKTSNSISFLKRNFNTASFQQQEETKYKNTLISKVNLNAIYIRLKSYYDEILELTTRNNSELTILKVNSQHLLNKQAKLIELKAIGLPEAKLGLNDLDEVKLPKAGIESEVKALCKQMSDLKRKHQNEVEYSKTIEHMCLNEKANLQQLNENIVIAENNIDTINRYKRTIDQNVNESNKKQRNYSQILLEVNDNIELAEDVIENQIQRKKKLDESIAKRGKRVFDKRIRVSKEIEALESKLHQQKEAIVNKLNETNEKKKAKYDREMSYIKIILCLNVIQKYFVNADGDQFNIKELIRSQDYKELFNERVLIVDDNNNGDVVFNSNNPSMQSNSNAVHKEKRGGLQQKRTHYCTHSHFHTHTHTHQGLKACRIDLEELKQKFDSITITRKALFQYHSDVISRIAFYRNQLNKLNHTHILLENKKTVCYRKVKDIISKDYKNVIALLKLNSRFEEFIGKNNLLINTSKVHNDIITSKKINDSLNSDDKSNQYHYQDNNAHQITEAQTLNYLHSIQLSNIEQKSIELFKTVDHIQSEIKSTIDNFETVFNLSKTEEEINPLLKSGNSLSRTVSLSSSFTSIEDMKFKDYFLELINYALAHNEIMQSIDNDIIDCNSLQEIKALLNSNDSSTRILIDRLESKHLSGTKMGLFKVLKKRKEIISALASIATFALRHYKEPQLSSDMRSANRHLTALKLKRPHSMCQVFIEDDSYLDREPTQTDNIVSTIKKNSVDERVILKLYNPTLTKTSYSRNLKNNLKLIQALTSSHAKANYSLKKKTGELKQLSNNLLLYNNSRMIYYIIGFFIEINVNKLTNSTYNDVVKCVVTSQVNLEKKNMKMGY